MTDMLTELGWTSLEECRKHQRLLMLYMIRNEIVAIDSTPYITPLSVQQGSVMPRDISSHNHPHTTTSTPSSQEPSQTGMLSLTAYSQHCHWQPSSEGCYRHPRQLKHKQPLQDRPMGRCNEGQ